MLRIFRCIGLTVVLGGATLAGAAPALAGTPHHPPRHHAKVTIDQARKTALARVPGTVKAAELEKEKGRWIYSFEIRPEHRTRKIVREVNIDADSGVIVEVTTERD
jgi:uncharacterized membrane protein YkoI